MINALVSALLQVGVVLLVAAGVWLAAGRREPFHRFVGLTAAPWTVVTLGFIAAAAVAFAVTRLPAIQALATAQGSVVGNASRSATGGELAAILAIRALVQTGLTEELVFRGLIGRNLIRRWGFAAGNSVQAACFGLLHLLLLLLPAATVGAVAAWVLVTAATGWLLGWVNHRYASGSILPGWAMHGGGNLAAYLILVSSS
jgi:uncharacterized protein